MKKIKGPRILFRLSKYGTWQQLDPSIEFDDQSKMYQYFIENFDSDFIQLRVNGVESKIKINK